MSLVFMWNYITNKTTETYKGILEATVQLKRLFQQTRLYINVIYFLFHNRCNSNL